MQRECMYPRPAKDVSQARLAITQWEDKWKAIVSEVGGDAKIPLKICPKDVKEQMMMSLDEVGENYENLKVKVVLYTTNKTKQIQGKQKEMHVPMEVEHVSGSEPEEEDCGMMGHLAKGCRRKGKCKRGRRRQRHGICQR